MRFPGRLESRKRFDEHTIGITWDTLFAIIIFSSIKIIIIITIVIVVVAVAVAVVVVAVVVVIVIVIIIIF